MRDAQLMELEDEVSEFRELLGSEQIEQLVRDMELLDAIKEQVEIAGML